MMPDRPAPPAHDVRKEPSTLLLDKPIRSANRYSSRRGCDRARLGGVRSRTRRRRLHPCLDTLRGRAMAGSHGNSRARIFCNKIEAELLAIGGYYLTADLNR